MTPESGTGRLPLILVGMAIAVAGEMSIGLLVFDLPGLRTALTVTLVVQLGALTAGLAAVPHDRRRPGRWRWFLAAGGFMIATAASASWTLDIDLMERWSTRGASLAALAALPMYCGGLLIHGVRIGEGVHRGVSVMIGATLGALVTGTLLFDRLQPVGIYLFALLCISLAALRTGMRPDPPASEFES